MQTKTLSKSALEVIENYKQLPFEGKKVTCPYFNNKKTGVRASLRVLVGKGSPKEIAEEAKIISLKEKIDLEDLNNENLKKFLVDHNLGVDCSGFVYQVLNAELKANKQGGIKKHINFSNIKNPIRKLIAKIRTIENTNVKTLSHEKNSKKIKIKEINPGDMILILGAGREKNFDHVLLVYKVDYENKTPKKIYYTHSLNWSSDGRYNHGIKFGEINIKDKHKKLTEQEWIEKGLKDAKNETFQKVKDATKISLNRII